jgi:hypothetical protein
VVEPGRGEIEAALGRVGVAGEAAVWGEAVDRLIG